MRWSRTGWKRASAAIEGANVTRKSPPAASDLRLESKLELLPSGHRDRALRGSARTTVGPGVAVGRDGHSRCDARYSPGRLRPRERWRPGNDKRESTRAARLGRAIVGCALVDHD